MPQNYEVFLVVFGYGIIASYVTGVSPAPVNGAIGADAAVCYANGSGIVSILSSYVVP
jgi:hypothetical protein